MARKSDFTLPPIPVDAIFSTQAERDDALLERVHNIPLEELHPFRDHPFKIQSGEEMDKMIESIRKVGAITPALARPLEDGGFELISGHRRLAACQVLGLKTMPVIVRKMTDDEAVIAMVDANLQRETILPSEKAFAYRMKLEAIKHQGRSISRQLVGKESADTLSNDESGRQVQRYIRLTYLIPELLTKVDEGKIAFSPAVEISFLTEDEQRILLDAIELNDCTPSHAQSIRLKKLSQDCVLTKDQIYEIMSEEKPNQQEHLRFRREDFNGYFPKSYTEQQIKKDILKGLELLQRHRQRNRDAR
ncbi:MAG: ParB/RepB/Spo0J family partition protein [Clostridia bacterium]|nr:ParB/RepB/Spo0J family partition protein [Clostridia bacterium]